MSGNLVTGNFIGTDVTGQTAVPNSGDGILLSSSTYNTIGGTTSGDRNLISGNGGDGVALDVGGEYGYGTSDGNLIEGNAIGVAADGSTPLPNAGNGVSIYYGNFNQVGGTATGQGNIIAANGQSGVQVDTGIGNALLSNSTYDNAGGGVVLVNAGNNDQAAPVLTDAVDFPGTAQVDGSLAVKAGTSYLVQFFGNNPASGQGGPSLEA